MESARSDDVTSELRERVGADAALKVQALSLVRQKSVEPLKYSEESLDFTRVEMSGGSDPHSLDPDAKAACALLDRAMAIRKFWQECMPIVDPDEMLAASPDSPRRSSHADKTARREAPGEAVTRGKGHLSTNSTDSNRKKESQISSGLNI
jgi:hypothetical protein